jgi:hypothetical protein
MRGPTYGVEPRQFYDTDHDHDVDLDDRDRIYGRSSEEGPGDRDRIVVLGQARERFGGLSIGGSFIGMLVALAMTFLLGGIAAAIIGGVGYEAGVETNGEELTVAGLIAGIVVLFLSFLIGGWSTGRIARYNGMANGAMTVVWMLVLGAVVAGAGIWIASEYNVFAETNLPDWFGRWFSTDELTIWGVVSAVVAIVLAFVGAIFGGMMGERYHRKADRYIADRMAHGDAAVWKERELSRR